MRVLFLMPDLGHGGAEKVLVNLVNHLHPDKYDVTVQTLFDVGVNRQYLQSHIRYIGGWKYKFRGNSHVIKVIPPHLLYRLCIHEKYDVVVSYLEGSTTRIVSGCTDKNVKTVCWIHIELNDLKKFRSGFLTTKGAIRSYLKYDKIIGVAESVRKEFECVSGRKYPSMSVLYNTNETDCIRTASKEKIDDIIFDKNIVNVCSVGKITPTKGFDRLVRVHCRLLKNGIRHRIYILGVGEERNKLEHYLEENGLRDTFQFLGYRDNPYKYVAACDIYVCSSRREGFSTAVTEALIVGTPVVSTNCSGAHELLGENNEYGIITDNSEDGLYDGLKKMITDSSLRLQYAEAAKQRGLLFSTEKTVGAVEKMLEELENV